VRAGNRALAIVSMTADDIRAGLKLHLHALIKITQGARLVEEMAICGGRARADIAVICDRLIGIEIKGPLDNLDRLPNQVDHYSKCFDQAYLVTDEATLRKARGIVPKWWGLIVHNPEQKPNFYALERRTTNNKAAELESLLGLLWREEIEQLFVEHLGSKPSPKLSKQMLRTQLLSQAKHSYLKATGLALLHARLEWHLRPIERYSV
jgi:hypothetical protein